MTKRLVFSCSLMWYLSVVSCCQINEQDKTGFWKYSNGEYFGDFIISERVLSKGDTLFGGTMGVVVNVECRIDGSKVLVLRSFDSSKKGFYCLK